MRISLFKIVLIFGVLLVDTSCLDYEKTIPDVKSEKLRTKEEKILEKPTENIIYNKEIKSNAFIINKLNCYWKSDSIFKIIEKDTIPLYELNRVLINSNNEEIILNLKSEDGSFYEYNGNGYFKDMNLDGYQDFVMYSEENSGSGGSYYNSYIYNIVKSKFELSKLHSGGVLTLDKKKRTLKSTWRSGTSINIYKILYFDNKGEIKYHENIVTEIGESIGTDKYKLTTTYKKFIKDNLVLEKIDTSIYIDN